MKYKLYATSLKAWDAMLAAIDAAEKSIFLEMYIFLDDTTESHDFLGQLKRKAREGVRVVIVADAYGSSGLTKGTVAAVRDAGIEFIFYSHWLRHIHRKILIVDEKTAFVGGVNIGRRFSHWNDLQLRLQGRAVKSILKSFAYAYETAGGKNRRILDFRKKTFAKKFRFWIVEHSPVRNIHSLKDQYREKISQAQKSICIVTPYFVPPRWLIALLDNAARRNVAVEIIVPKTTDLPLVNRLNHHYMHKLCSPGIKFFLATRMNHAKALLIDDEIGLIGSQNVDPFSFHINTEAGLFFTEKTLTKELREIINGWKSATEEFAPHKYRMKAVDYAILALVKLLKPIL